MPRHAGLDASGMHHHVIILGLERGQIVTDDADREAFVARRNGPGHLLWSNCRIRLMTNFRGVRQS